MKSITFALTLLVLLFLTTSVFAIQILSQTTRNYVPQSVSDCRPVCLNQNSNTEGWYYSCNKSAIKYTSCRYCSISCMNALNAFEGWYDSCTGLPLVFTDCNKTVNNPASGDVTTTTQVTTTVITTIKATTTTTLPKCAPVCIKKTPSLKGWFNACTKELIKQASCTHCSLVYKIENGVAGWYDGCNSRLIMTAGTVITIPSTGISSLRSSTTTTTSVATVASTAITSTTQTTTFNSASSSMRSSMVSSAVSSALSRIASSVAAR